MTKRTGQGFLIMLYRLCFSIIIGPYADDELFQAGRQAVAGGHARVWMEESRRVGWHDH